MNQLLQGRELKLSPQHSLPAPHHDCLSTLLLLQGPAASAANQINETFS